MSGVKPDRGEPPLQLGRGTLADHVALKHAEFDRVKREGRQLAGKRVIIGLLPAPDQLTRLGIVVSRRYDTHAVERNRARRLIRESFRLLRHGFKEPHWIVIISRKHLHNATLQDLQHDLSGALSEAGILTTGDRE